MNETRKKKIESEIIKSVANLIVSGKLKDPRIGIVSVHRAELSNDMTNVKIWVTSYTDDKGKKTLLNALRSARGYFQHILAEQLKLRLTPKILFLWDEDYIKSLEMNQFLDNLPPIRNYQEESEAKEEDTEN
ncbi:MAG TPA: 30S ribosome-binding factor RbfA [Leptospiraceae bacterium]|nr:30S ribosome-binding factor RbfA [Leptospiraceae bacterium]HMW05363.1 30S ribosome-binding factor RbfA [Leptospiraceae bacterium]HMX34350.1 30S ribosome-binding factor RbfA [Leptospiraceae bacterium]HMY31558.1 30S ribosome-binding factor RbfA [Leptospiraceae bacterium]HMZ64465.1 30S ribosome-binding factor RbfA [Leptospiraceae bacterium]